MARHLMIGTLISILGQGLRIVLEVQQVPTLPALKGVLLNPAFWLACMSTGPFLGWLFVYFEEQQLDKDRRLLKGSGLNFYEECQ